MDTMSAFIRGEVNRGKEMMVFDWDRAAQILKERDAEDAAAGLDQDWGYTGGEILRDGAPVKQEDTYTYLASTWATPQLYVDGEYIDCYKMESEAPGWDAKTYWPDSALKIFKGEQE